MSDTAATLERPEVPSLHHEETYLERACRLIASHGELFARAPSPRLLRVVPRPQSPNAVRRRRSRQLALPLPPTIER